MYNVLKSEIEEIKGVYKEERNPQFYELLNVVSKLRERPKSIKIAMGLMMPFSYLSSDVFIKAPPQEIRGEYILGTLCDIEIIVTPELTNKEYEICQH